MNSKELIAYLENKIEMWASFETNDLYDKGYFAGKIDFAHELIQNLEDVNA